MKTDGKPNWEKTLDHLYQNRKWIAKSGAITFAIIAALDKQKITQAELAKRLSISPAAVSKLLSGKENLTLETIAKLEEALNTKLITIADSGILRNYNAENHLKNTNSTEAAEEKDNYLPNPDSINSK